MRLPARKSTCPWCEPSITPGRLKATRRKRFDGMAFTFAIRTASHRALRRRLQQFPQLLGVELRAAGGEMPARLGAGGGEIDPAVLPPSKRRGGAPRTRR